MNGAHWIEQGMLFVRHHPGVWPATLFPFFVAGFLSLSRSAAVCARFVRLEPRLLAVGGAACLGLYALSNWLYLGSAVFHDVFESTQASVTAVFLRGGAVYAGLNTEERYSGPYGPTLYLALGLSQQIFGSSVFSTKLPGVVAALLSTALFWGFTRRRHGAAAAWALAGLEAALLLAFRHVSFWAKPDPLILLCVTLGLYAVRREGWKRALLLGICLGLAVDLKPHAAAYFFPVFVLAHGNGWRRGTFALCGAVGLAVALLPFLIAARQFSLVNYVGFLCVTADEGFGRREALSFCRWAGMLAALIYIAGKLAAHLFPGQEQLRMQTSCMAYRAALALGGLLVATPASSVGAGPHHLIPFLPLVLIAVGGQFSSQAGSAGEWLPARPVALWRGAAYAMLAACALIAAQTPWRIACENALRAPGADAYLVEMRQLLAEHPRATLLMGVGDRMNRLATFFRHEIVFAGNPVGIDAALAMDYQRGGVAEPNLGRLVAEVNRQRPCPVWWVIPRGAAPFSAPNFYNSARPAYSETFRRDFYERFELREQWRFFDLYAARSYPAYIPDRNRLLSGNSEH